MIFIKLFALSLLTVLPWFSMSVVVPKTWSKRCETLKVPAEAVKDLSKHISDFTTALTKVLPDPKTVQSVAGVVAETLLRDDVLKVLSYVGPMGGIVAACLSIGKVALEEKDKEELKAAISELSIKLDSLSVHIDDSVNKILAHVDDLHFQELVTSPAEELKGKYMDYLQSFNADDLLKLETRCRHIMPTTIFDRMKLTLEKNSRKIMLNHQYTDLAFAQFKAIYTNVFFELMPIHFACEELTNDAGNEHETEQQAIVRRYRKIERRLNEMYDRFDLMNENRPRKVWKLMSTKIDHFYDQYKALKNDTVVRRNFIERIVNQLNNDYRQIGYDYAFGVIKNKEKYYHFSCRETACIYKDKPDLVVWIMRTRPCYDRRRNMVTRASTCLQFEMLLYSRFNEKHAFDIKNVTEVTEMFKRNCRIKNLIGFFSYQTKLEGNAYGAGREANIRPTNRDRVPYNIMTQRKHVQIRWKDYDEMVFWADCRSENKRPFNFIEEYCTPESAWPTCRLTEHAFEYHRLENAKNPYDSNTMVYHKYKDTWAKKAFQNVKTFFKKLLPFKNNKGQGDDHIKEVHEQ